ncbi:hypothetical protein GGR56DRAFT_672288 [Xylariaceae sp. FL0804]|nr:hypothetical protein GGR56DRAFT_672288 [Xylariaceae sp. FL0804]
MADRKITSKNLSYDSTLPPFLARLHGQQHAQHGRGYGGYGGDSGGGPDPLLAARRRHRGARTASEEAEDAPLVVDAAGNEVVLDHDHHDHNHDARELVGGEGEGEGAGRKRRAGRVVGDAHDDIYDQDYKDAEADANEAWARRHVVVAAARRRSIEAARKKEASDNAQKTKTTTTTTTMTTTTTGATTTAGPKNKKARKKIKLSFGDDDADAD